MPPFIALLNAEIDGLHEFLWNHAPSDFVDEFVAASRLTRFQPDLHVGVLAPATYLPYVLAFAFRMPANGLQVNDFELTHVERDLVFAHDAIADDL